MLYFYFTVFSYIPEPLPFRGHLESSFYFPGGGRPRVPRPERWGPGWRRERGPRGLPHVGQRSRATGAAGREPLGAAGGRGSGSGAGRPGARPGPAGWPRAHLRCPRPGASTSRFSNRCGPPRRAASAGSRAGRVFMGPESAPVRMETPRRAWSTDTRHFVLSNKNDRRL